MHSRTLVAPLLTAILYVCCGTLSAASSADTFSFSAQTAKDAEKNHTDAANQAAAIQALVSVPCRQRLKDRKILLLIGERHADQWLTSQDRYGKFIAVIESRLRALGLKPYTQQQITASIAQAEIDAYFKNDPDAALSASKRLGASYILRGSISTQAGVNPVVNVNEVAVDIDLTLSGVSGSVLSEVSAHADSYSGSDTPAMALTLVREKADPLVAQLYNDYCRADASR